MSSVCELAWSQQGHMTIKKLEIENPMESILGKVNILGICLTPLKSNIYQGKT